MNSWISCVKTPSKIKYFICRLAVYLKMYGWSVYALRVSCVCTLYWTYSWQLWWCWVSSTHSRLVRLNFNEESGSFGKYSIFTLAIANWFAHSWSTLKCSSTWGTVLQLNHIYKVESMTMKFRIALERTANIYLEHRLSRPGLISRVILSFLQKAYSPFTLYRFQRDTHDIFVRYKMISFITAQSDYLDIFKCFAEM